MTDTTFRISQVDLHVLRFPIATPVRTSFGVMKERPALFVRVQARDGAFGWGEVWCNFPACGVDHRAALIETLLAPLLCSREFESAAAAFDFLTASTEVLAIQSGEPGPIAQSIAGLDLALWDMLARRAGQPLWRYLGGTSGEVKVYASGINPDNPAKLVATKRAEGFRAFKLKVGFDVKKDLANLYEVRQLIGDQDNLMIDANQAWNLDTTLSLVKDFEPLNLGWLEEPLRADRPIEEWQRLSEQSPCPLAGGENAASQPDFRRMIESGAYAVVQPDVAKWGGFSANRAVVKAVMENGLTFCPHYLGGGIGLLHSAHLLAAMGGQGMLEIDANHNPLRQAFCGPLNQVSEGRAKLNDQPGIGLDPTSGLALPGCTVASSQFKGAH